MLPGNNPAAGTIAMDGMVTCSNTLSVTGATSLNGPLNMNNAGIGSVGGSGINVTAGGIRIAQDGLNVVSGGITTSSLTSGGFAKVDSLYVQGSGQTTSNASNTNFDSSTGQIKRSTSSLRYKKNVRDLDIDIDAVFNQLRAVQFQSRSEGDDPVEWYGGLIAEELHAAGFDKWVFFDEEGRPDGIAYDQFAAAVLLKAVQHLGQKNEALEARLTALESA
jgi:hypothetical protein